MSPNQSEDRYLEAWRALMRQVRQGSSWSGAERNRFFLNTGLNAEGIPRYADTSAASGLNFPDDARGVGLTDWDGDGDLDIWMRNRTAPRLRLMLNRHADPANADPDGADWVALRLEGRSSNRDAIGARVELTLSGESTPLIKTLRAGGTFLSQSSKWIHFGCGNASKIEKVVVRWPNGTRESFSSVRKGARFGLREGTGVAELLTLTPREGTTFSKVGHDPPPTPNRSIAILPRRIPIPPLDSLVPTEGSGQPLWLLMWSPSCPHCREVLQGLGEPERQAALERAGLAVHALAVDGTEASARRLITETGFPFPWGMIDEKTLSWLGGLQSSLFDQPPRNAVPLHLLITGNWPRSLVAIFYGGIEGAEMTEFMDIAAATDAQLRHHAAPYPGQWYTKPNENEVLLEYLGEKIHPFDREASAFYFAQAGSVSQAAKIVYSLAMEAREESRLEDAERGLRKAIELDPGFAQAHNNLGALLANQGQFAKARACFERAIQLDPKNEKAQLNLELLLKMR